MASPPRSRAGARPRGYPIERGWQFESAEATAHTLLILGFAVVLGIFLPLSVVLRSPRRLGALASRQPAAVAGRRS